MKSRNACLLLGLLCALPALADIKVLVVSEATARKDSHMVSRNGLEASLSKLLGQNVTVAVTDDLTDAMRSTRSAGYDVFIAPAQVAASAIAHGHELIGSTASEEQYVLVANARLHSVADIRRERIYLPQQDSIYTYMARGLLTANGLSFKDLRNVEFARYPQAGLTAITLNLTEATVIRREDWEAWEADNKGAAKVLATSGAVPGGFSVTISKALAPEVRGQMSKWFTSAVPSNGLKRVAHQVDLAHYKKVAELGTFTPTSLPGATVVSAEDVKRLVSQGAVVVDTRTEKEYKAKHLAGARFVPYVEKSLKDVAFDAALDDFSGLKSLNAAAPTIFMCNGAECWKSYKASRAAIAARFSKVYWYRGGLPDWERSGASVDKG